MKATRHRITRRATVSRVPVLLASCGPSAVSGRVITVVVDAVDGVRLRWLSAHIGQEVLEGMQPAFANPNPAPAVVRKAKAFRVIAAGFHRKPRRVFGSRSVFNAFDSLVFAVANVLARQGVAVSAPSHVVGIAPTMPINGPLATLDRAHTITAFTHIVMKGSHL